MHPKALFCVLLSSLALSFAGPPAFTPPPVVAPPPRNPLSFADGKVVFDWEDQLRFEARENTFDFHEGRDALTDDAWLLNRFRLGLTLKPTPWIKLYFQGQDSREIDSDRPDVPGVLGAEGDNPFDLRQAWVELGGGDVSSFSAKLGRQVLLYGDQRLIGPLEWNNISRTFDAAKIRWSGDDGAWVDVFVSSVVIPDRDGFDESDHDSVFLGLYARLPNIGPNEPEIYALRLSDDDRKDDFFTFGSHWKSAPGKLGPWDYEAEFAFQTGEAGGQDLRAFAAYAELGHTFDAAWKPRVSLEYSFGGGDAKAGDGEQNAFQNLFPTNHPHYGFMDLFSWSNVHDVVLHMSAKPTSKLMAGLDVHSFWLADTADAWRRANARTAVRPANEAAGSWAGVEADLLMSWKMSENATLTAGYSHFFAGDYLNDTGAGDDADFLYLMLGLKF